MLDKKRREPLQGFSPLVLVLCSENIAVYTG